MRNCRREEEEAMSHTSLRSEFEELVELDAPAIQVPTDCVFTEGPVWHPVDHFLLFSDMPGDVRRRWDRTVAWLRSSARRTNATA
jgi:gluconolactonase